MGFITAGGHSSRMGQDKAWMEIQGRPIIAAIIDALLPVTSRLAIIANQDEYKKLGFPVFADTYKDIGPLEAIRMALTHTTTANLILVGCDMPFVTSELFSLLLERMAEPATTPARHQATDRQLADVETFYFPFAVVPLNEEARPEPMCAVYATQALAQVTRLIESGVRKVSVLFENIPTRYISFPEIRHLPNAQYIFQNLNTPEDFAAAAKIISATEPQKRPLNSLNGVQDKDISLF